MPKLEQSFDVAAPVDTVWRALIDVERVAPCLPGAELTPGGDEGTYQGTFSVKLGPATAAYRGTITIEEADEAARRATMRATGTDKRGQGGAKATIVSTLAEAGDGATRVDVVTDYAITGRLAAFGRGGMIQDVSNRLLREFAGCLQETLAAGAPAAPQAASTAAAAATAASVGMASPAADPTATAGPAPPPARPIGGLSLLLGALRDRLRRLFGRR